MLKILKISRRASQNNFLNKMYTVITQLTQYNTATSLEGPKIRDLQETLKRLSGDQYKNLSFMIY